MRYKPAIVFLLLIECHFLLGQDDQKVLKIREQFNEWKILLKNENIEPKFFYHSVWGINFENDAPLLMSVRSIINKVPFKIPVLAIEKFLSDDTYPFGVIDFLRQAIVVLKQVLKNSDIFVFSVTDEVRFNFSDILRFAGLGEFIDS